MMPSSLFAAWRTILKRLRSDWLILLAAFVTIALATILLSSGPIYADAVTLSALGRTIEDAPIQDSQVEISQRIPPDLYAASERVVVQTVEAAFQSTGSQTRRMIEAESFGFPDPSESQKVDLIAFQHFEGIASHATLEDGDWPSDGETAVEAAIPAPTAELLGLDVGDEFTAVRRFDFSFDAEVRISGIYQINDPTDPFWFDDPLALYGVSQSTTFRTVGPFVVTVDSLSGSLAPERLTANWRVFPSYENLTVDNVPQLRSGVTTLEDDLNIAYETAVEGDVEQTSEISVTTGLPILLSDTERSLTITKSSVLALLLQLAILAGYALVLTAGLLVGARRGETHLLRSRGASPGQVGVTGVFEGILLTLPAALAGPWMAARAIDLLDVYGPLASIGLTIEPLPNPEAYLLAGLAAIGAVIALSWPAYRSAKAFPDATHEPRQVARSGAQNAGVDIALLVLAVIVFWQLQTVGPEISATIQGRFGVDPLLLIAPALGLLVGAFLALRVVPLLGRLAERVTVSGRRAITALSAWQVARRPRRYARSALLLIMAVGIGFFAAAFSKTWLDSQADQAEFQVGSDIRVSPNRRTNDSIPDLNLPTAHEGIHGVDSSMSVSKRTTQMARSGNTGEFVFLDSTRAPHIVAIREDLAPDFAELMADLAAARPTMASIPLPGEPTAVGLALSAAQPWPFPPKFAGPNYKPPFDLRVSAVIQDGDGLIHKIHLGLIPVNIGAVRLEGDLTYPLSDDTLATTRAPHSLIDIEILSPIPVVSQEVHVELRGVFTADTEGSWSRVETDISPASWALAKSEARVVSRAAIQYADEQPTHGLGIDITTGAAFSGVSPPLYFSIRPRGTNLPDSFPILTTESFLEANSVVIGDTIRMSSLRIPNNEVTIIGTVDRFPTVTDATRETILVDLPTMQMMAYAPGANLETPKEYWLATDGGDDQSVEAALRGPLFQSVKVTGRESLTSSLTSDPVALGTIGALSLGFVAAAVFATVGFAVSATVSARERVNEFGLLRALGLSSKQLAGWLSLEQGVLVIIALALGTLVGALLTALVLPLISLTQQGEHVVPEVIVVFPWQTVIQLQLAVLAILAVIVLMMTLLVRRLGLGALLRLGDD